MSRRNHSGMLEGACTDERPTTERLWESVMHRAVARGILCIIRCVMSWGVSSEISVGTRPAQIATKDDKTMANSEKSAKM